MNDYQLKELRAKIIIYIVSALIGFLILLILGSLITWTPNMSEWTKGGRAALSVFYGIYLIANIFITIGIYDEYFD
jgi:TRAP-type C4-dicarboxylate transport system permease small subunit